jgi:2'-5' RNA ligase
VTDGAVRAFIALEIPEEVKSALGEGREPLRAELPQARWVRSGGQHLTLKFLGESDRRVLGDLVADLRPRLAGCGPVTVTLAGGGFFPRPARPRVAWIGGSAEGVGPVVDAVERTAVRYGFPAERRRWSLHLTQARLDRPWPDESVERFLRWADGLRLPTFSCREAVLFSSRLQRGGAVYTPLERMSLE